MLYHDAAGFPPPALDQTPPPAPSPSVGMGAKTQSTGLPPPYTWGGGRGWGPGERLAINTLIHGRRACRLKTWAIGATAIFFRTAIVSFFALALAGCTQQITLPVDRITSVVFTPEGTGASAPWVTADCRLLRVKNAGFLDRLGLAWQVAAVPGGQAQARFAMLTPEQVLKLNREGKGRFEYMPVEDGAAFLLTKAGSAILYSKPQFAARTPETFIDVEVSAVAARDASALDLFVSASEIDVKVATMSTVPSARKPWVGAARIPIAAARCALIQIPTVDQNSAGTRTRLMLLVVPGSFTWKDQRLTNELPWGKFRQTAIEGRSLAAKWAPSWMLRPENSQQPN